MRFYISRVSQWDDKKAPCPAAFETAGGWYIEIPDLKALMELSDQEGKLVFTKHDARYTAVDGTVGSIIIYDDYIE